MQIISLFATLLLALLQVLSGTHGNTPRYQAEDKLAPYVGTWVGHTPTGDFKLVLEEHKQFHIGNNPPMDFVFGWHTYVATGSPVNKSSALPADQRILECSTKDDKPGEISGSSWDEVTRKSFNVRLSLANADKTKLSWLVTGERETWSLDPAKPILPGFSVPTSLVLTKVE